MKCFLANERHEPDRNRYYVPKQCLDLPVDVVHRLRVFTTLRPDQAFAELSVVRLTVLGSHSSA